MVEEKRITRITVENYDYKTTWEIPYSDSNLNEIFSGFIGCLVGITYHENQILKAMKEYAEERLPEEECENFEDYEEID